MDRGRQSEVLVGEEFTMPPTPEDQVQFLQNLQRLLSEGLFAATYKYALLLALADIAVEKGDDSGNALLIETRLIAEKFISYYWRQVIPYIPRGTASGILLSQNTGRQAAIITHVEEARHEAGHSLMAVRGHRHRWTVLVREVDRVVRVMPLWKLQTVGGGQLDFLYENTGHGASIELKPGVAFCFRNFYGLVSELVRGAWVRYIRRQNQHALGTTTDLTEFLFGSERANLKVVQPILEDQQQGRCFYCRTALRKGTSHVDHFIPWSRYPVDLGHNFVLCHATCNSAKADHLACNDHLSAWVERNRKVGQQLADAFNSRNVIHDLRASEGIAEWAYWQTSSVGGLVWSKSRELITLGACWKIILDTGHNSGNPC